MLFASYSRGDRALVEPLLDDLRALGHDVWLDEELSGGTVWWDEILARIRQCEVFLFLLSPSSVTSEACLLELDYAAATERIVLPVELVATPPASVPTSLAARQVVRYTATDRTSAIALARALSGHDTAPPLPDPLPAPPPLPGSYFTTLRDQIASETSLDLEQQLGIVHRLRARLVQDDDAADVEPLVARFLARDDVYAAIATQLGDLRQELATRRAAATVPPPTAAPAPPRWRKPAAAERAGVAIAVLAVGAALVALLGGLYRTSGGTVAWDQYGWVAHRWQLIALVVAFVAAVATSFATAGRARRIVLGAGIVVAAFGLAWWWEQIDELLLQTYISEGSIEVGAGLTLAGLAFILQLVTIGTLLAAPPSPR